MKKVLKMLQSMKKSQLWIVWKIQCTGYLFFLIPQCWSYIFNGEPDFYLGNVFSPPDKIKETEMWPSQEVTVWPSLALNLKRERMTKRQKICVAKCSHPPTVYTGRQRSLFFPFWPSFYFSSHPTSFPHPFNKLSFCLSHLQYISDAHDQRILLIHGTYSISFLFKLNLLR